MLSLQKDSYNPLTFEHRHCTDEWIFRNNYNELIAGLFRIGIERNVLARPNSFSLPKRRKIWIIISSFLLTLFPASGK
jgi:hypothetical protein